MENNKLVVKDNALIDASFNLSLIEQRLLLLAIVQAREITALTSSTAIEIKASLYATQFNIHEKEAYNALKSACDLLFERRFSYIDKYKGNQLIKKVRWVSEIGYLENKGVVLLNLSDTVISLISRLEQQFTKYHLDQVSAFKSKDNKAVNNKKIEADRKLTTKQVEMFSDKLSKLTSFQSYFLADAGMDMDSYRKGIASKLTDPFYVNSWKKYLIEVGLKY